MPSRPRLTAGLGDAHDSPTALWLAGAGLLGQPGGVEPGWVDNFMRLIFEKDYDSAREVLRKAIAHGVNHGLAEQYAKVLEDFLRKRDEIEDPVVLGRFGACVVRDMGERGRGLAVPAFASWGDVLWNEQPLAYIQSPCSRRCAQACCACLAPVGSLASQLAHLGLPAPAGAEDVVVGCSGGAEGQQPALWHCTGAGCAEVFCSSSCRDWALNDSSHALLCAGRLPAPCRTALEQLECLAEESDTEHLLLLAHSVAQMTLRRQHGEPLEEVLQRYVHQFASKPWDALAAAGNGADSDDTPESRRDLLARAAALLQEVFTFADAETVAPLLETELLSGLLGTYELVNMCISIPHPLNGSGQRVCEVLEGTGLLARIAEMQSQVEEDSGSEGQEEEGEDQGGEEHPDTQVGEEDAAESARKGTLFANVIGSALCEALAYTNHSCLPNCNIDFTTAGDTDSGPGLWVRGVARRPLMPGDEVLMAYVPSVIGKPLEVRQAKMQKFGFPCRCRSCVTDEMLAAEDVLPAAGGFADELAVLRAG